MHLYQLFLLASLSLSAGNNLFIALFAFVVLFIALLLHLHADMLLFAKCYMESQYRVQLERCPVPSEWLMHCVR